MTGVQTCALPICDTACEVWITSDTCAYDDACCESSEVCCDDCTTFDWTLTVYDDQPYEEGEECEGCVENTCATVIASTSGTGCPVDLNVFGCLTEDEWAELEITEYYVEFEAVDIVGNTVSLYGVLEVDTGSCDLTVLNDAKQTPSVDCMFEVDDTWDNNMNEDEDGQTCSCNT